MVCSIIARHVDWSCAAMCHVAVGSVRVPKAARPGKVRQHRDALAERQESATNDANVYRNALAAVALVLGLRSCPLKCADGHEGLHGHRSAKVQAVEAVPWLPFPRVHHRG